MVPIQFNAIAPSENSDLLELQYSGPFDECGPTIQKYIAAESGYYLITPLVPISGNLDR